MRYAVPILVFVLPLLTGCANRYYYVPAEQANATMSGSPAARYDIPPDTRLGDVRIASFGIDEIQLGEDTESVPALHTRLIIANERGRRNWTVDVRQLVIQFSSRRPPVPPSLINSTGAGMPIITIPRGESRTIDVYHVLPGNLDDADDLPQFDLVWQVQTDSELVTERTPFDRRETEPAPRASLYGGWGMGMGMGPYPYAPWGPWYDPWYGRPIIIQRVVPAPRVYYSPHR